LEVPTVALIFDVMGPAVQRAGERLLSILTSGVHIKRLVGAVFGGLAHPFPAGTIHN